MNTNDIKSTNTSNIFVNNIYIFCLPVKSIIVGTFLYLKYITRPSDTGRSYVYVVTGVYMIYIGT
jgi:hypothetical protein